MTEAFEARDRGIQVGDVIRVKGYDREFEVGGINDKGVHPDTYETCKMVSFGFQGYGRPCHTRHPEDELEKVNES